MSLGQLVAPRDEKKRKRRRKIREAVSKTEKKREIETKYGKEGREEARRGKEQGGRRTRTKSIDGEGAPLLGISSGALVVATQRGLQCDKTIVWHWPQEGNRKRKSRRVERS